MVEKLTTLTVRLVVQSPSCGPGDVAKHLGIEPTSIAIKGISSAPGRPPARVSYWKLTSALESTELSLLSHVRSLMARIGGHVANFRALPQDADISLRCGVSEYGLRPELHLGAPELRWLVDLGASLDIDYYAIGADCDNE